MMGLAQDLADDFRQPPDSARPGAYWYFMDGNQDREAMTTDLEAMHHAGLRKALFLEVNIGVPRGPVDFMSPIWQDNFAHAVRTADRLGMEIILGTGPGRSGAGGPWIDPSRSMQHLCASSITVVGPGPCTAILPVPPPRAPSQFAGLSPDLAAQRDAWHADVAVLAFPTPAATEPPEHLAVKALYETQPYSIWKHVPRFMPAPATHSEPPADAIIGPNQVLDLTTRLRPDGSLDWSVPPGQWTVMRFAARSTGATTRPAPTPGHGFETDKFDAAAFAFHFDQFHKKLLERVGPRRPGRGWTALHLDSWEMSSQNWSARFRDEFQRRRGYDPQPFFPAYTGLIVGSRENTERFLWDLRKTAQELVIENHAHVIRRHAHQNGFYYSNQPYDMNPAGDIELGAVADIPSCEFWISEVDTVYSCIEASSIAHTMGRPVVRAEAFTSPPRHGYPDNPADLKNQTDWAFAMGINDIIFHTFQHQPLGLNAPKPGLAMGPHGIHWHRHQTFWPMVRPYHDYIARCGQMLRQGVSVADILYLVPEGAPHIFLPPDDAFEGQGLLREKKAYGFDAVSPGILMARAKADGGRIVFPEGTTYRLLVLPIVETMTPELLAKLEALVEQGATVIGTPPAKSPSLSQFPQCDARVHALARKIWGGLDVPQTTVERSYGKGRIVWGGPATAPTQASHPSLMHQHSHWIWTPQDDPATHAPAGVTRCFQKTFQLDTGRTLRSARLHATADNGFEVWLNGVAVASGNNFNEIQQVDIRPALKSGTNLLAVAASNAGSEPNPAGLIALVHIEFEDGHDFFMGTDAAWRVADNPEDAWQSETKTGPHWRAARVLGPASMAPWANVIPKSRPDSLYPSYGATVALLKTWGVPPAFDTTGPLRYHQRRTPTRDIFFVGNRTAEPVAIECAFRTDGATPQLWDPVTGARRRLPRWTIRDGIVSVPLQFAPRESWFIVFDRRARGTAANVQSENFSAETILATLDGPYEVTFDPAWGGPDKPVAFDTLLRWDKHADEGIRYYSGQAVYRKMFDRPQDLPDAERVILDLGTVHKLAAVKINGEDLGIAWTFPYRVDFHASLLRPTGNHLEIAAVNTWVNRLIGDQQPAHKAVRHLEWKSGLLGGARHPAGRYTFTTAANDYTANSPLEPSGLLGPVTLRALGVAAFAQNPPKAATTTPASPSNHSPAPEQPSAAVPLQAREFPLSAVRLLDGPFRRAMDVNRAYLLRLEPDRLLAGFRREAGLAKRADPYGGWETIPNEGRYSLAGQALGHYLSALSLMASATGDPDCRRRVEYIVAELSACQQAAGSGILCAFPESKQIFAELAAGEIKSDHLFGLNGGYVPLYVTHKVMAGLRDAWLLLGNRDARDVLVRMAAWLGTVVGPLIDPQIREMLETEHGGIMEVVADVYAITGDPQYLALAKRLNHQSLFAPLTRGEDTLTGQHANAQIPKAIGMERIFQLTGDPAYGKAPRFFWDLVARTRSFVIGGHGENEFFFAPEDFAAKGVVSPTGPETCNTYNMIKLSRRQWLVQPSATLADFIERSLYNHILPSQEPEHGGFVYFTSMRPGHYRTYSSDTEDFWCCTDTGMESHAKHNQFIYAHAGPRLWIDLLIPSELDWADQGVRLRLETRFPEDGKATLVFDAKEPRKLEIAVRCPGWLESGTMKLAVNATPERVEAPPGSYAVIERTWKAGDRIEVEWPLSLRTEMLPRSDEWISVLWGPIVLAGELGTEGIEHLDFSHTHNYVATQTLPVDHAPVFVGKPGDVPARIKPVPDRPLAFRTVGLARPADVSLAPFYRVHRQRYAVYWRLIAPKPDRDPIAERNGAR